MTLSLSTSLTFTWRFVVADVLEPILGLDFLRSFGLSPDLSSATLVHRPSRSTVRGFYASPAAPTNGHTGHALLSDIQGLAAQLSTATAELLIERDTTAALHASCAALRRDIARTEAEIRATISVLRDIRRSTSRRVQPREGPHTSRPPSRTTSDEVSFSVVHGKKCEKVLKHLSQSGIGSKYSSTISMKSATPAWDGSLISLQPGSTVIGAMEEVTAQAEFTFDFLILLLISGFVAALGLMENSIMILIASMLISPLMGPVLSCAFGTMTRDTQLIKMGIMNEMFGLLFCIIEGFFCGLIVGLSTEHFGTNDWPTEEMISRGELPSIWMGIIIAALSGIAVAVSELGQKTASLVGVAISASLLPPAVNTGLLWALTCTYSIYGKSPVLKKPLKYTDNAVTELAVLGSVSLCLTLINIIFIFVSAAVVLKLKIGISLKPAADKYMNRNLKLACNIKKNVSSQDSLHSIEKRFSSNISLRNALQEDLKFTSNLNGPHGIKNKEKCLHITGIAKFFNFPSEKQTPRTSKSFENLNNSDHYISSSGKQHTSMSETESITEHKSHLADVDEDLAVSTPDAETRPHSVISKTSIHEQMN